MECKLLDSINQGVEFLDLLTGYQFEKNIYIFIYSIFPQAHTNVDFTETRTEFN
jgi:hypothetical protein